MHAFYDSDDVLLDIQDSFFVENTADFGAVLSFENPRGTAVVKNCLFQKNLAIMLPYDAYFVKNFVPSTTDFGGGGVIALRGSPRTILLMEKNVYDSNWSSKRG